MSAGCAAERGLREAKERSLGRAPRERVLRPEHEGAAFVARLLSVRLRLDAAPARKIMFEVDNCRTLRRWLHDAGDAPLGLLAWVRDLVAVKEQLIEAARGTPRLLSFLLCAVADGLYGSGPLRDACVELVGHLVREAQSMASAQLLQPVLLQWLCSSQTCGLEFVLVGLAFARPLTPEACALAEWTLHAFHGRHYDLFAHALLRIGTDEPQQRICQYSAFCSVLLDGRSGALRHELLRVGVVTQTFELALHMLELAVIAANKQDASAGGAFLACARDNPACLAELLGFFRMMCVQYPEALAQPGVSKRLLTILGAHLPDYYLCALEAGQDVQGDTLLSALYRAFAQALAVKDPSGAALAQVTFSIVDANAQQTAFVERVCAQLAAHRAILPAGALGEHILAHMDRLALQGPMVQLSHACLDVLEPPALVAMCNRLADSCVAAPTERGAAFHDAAVQLIFAILTAPDQPDLGETRLEVLSLAVGELQARHDIGADAARLQGLRLRKSELATKVRQRNDPDGKPRRGYAAKLSKLEAGSQPRRARPVPEPCDCFRSQADCALRAFVHELVVVELQAGGSNAALWEEVHSMLLWSSCHKIQAILDEARLFTTCSSAAGGKLAPLASASASSAAGEENDEEESWRQPQAQALGLVPAARSLSPERRRQLRQLDARAKEEVRELEEQVQLRRREAEQAAQARRAQAQREHDHLRQTFEEQRHRRKDRLKQQQRDRMRSDEIQKEYLDAKDTGHPALERVFEAKLAEAQAKWVGIDFIDTQVANQVFDTVAPYIASFRRVFDKFASQGVNQEDTFQTMLEDKSTLSSREWLAFLRAFQIVPQVIHANAGLELFARTTAMRGTEMGYLSFLDALAALANHEPALQSLWVSSGFRDITAAGSPRTLKPGWFAARRGAAANKPGACPCTRFHVLCEHLRRVGLRNFALGRCLGTWPRRLRAVPQAAVQVFNPNVLLVLEILDETIASVIGTPLLISEAEIATYDKVARVQHPSVEPRAYQSAPKAEASAQPSPAETSTPFARWLKRQKGWARKSHPSTVAKDSVLDFEACARVLWRVVGQVDDAAKAKELTASLQRGAEKYNQRARGQYKEQQRAQEDERAALKRNKELYDKERGKRVEQARQDREARRKRQRDQEAEQLKREEDKERRRAERQRQNRAKLADAKNKTPPGSKSKVKRSPDGPESLPTKPEHPKDDQEAGAAQPKVSAKEDPRHDTDEQSKPPKDSPKEDDGEQKEPPKDEPKAAPDAEAPKSDTDKQSQPKGDVDEQREPPKDEPKAAPDAEAPKSDTDKQSQPKGDVDEQREPPNDKQKAGPGAEAPKSDADEQKADADEQKADADEPEANADEPKADADEPKADPDEPKADADEPKADADEENEILKDAEPEADGAEQFKDSGAENKPEAAKGSKLDEEAKVELREEEQKGET